LSASSLYSTKLRRTIQLPLSLSSNQNYYFCPFRSYPSDLNILSMIK